MCRHKADIYEQNNYKSNLDIYMFIKTIILLKYFHFGSQIHHIQNQRVQCFHLLSIYFVYPLVPVKFQRCSLYHE